MSQYRVCQLFAFVFMVTAILAALELVPMLVALSTMFVTALWFAFAPQDW